MMENKTLPPVDINWDQYQLFNQLSEHEKQHLAPFMKICSFQKGETILHQDDKTKFFYLIINGDIEVLSNAEKLKLNELHAGDYFGLMAVVGSKTERTATIVAKTKVTLYQVDGKAFFEQAKMADTPDLLMKIMGNYSEGLETQLIKTNENIITALKDRLLFSFMFISVIMILFFYSFFLGAINRFIFDTNLIEVIALIGLTLFTILCIASVKISHYSLRDFGFQFYKWKQDLWDCCSKTAVICAGLLFLKLLLIKTVMSLSHIPLFDIYGVKNGNYTSLLIKITLYAIFVPAQELVARGWMQGLLQRILLGRYAALIAIVVSNALFSMAHQHFSISFTAVTFFLGLFWGWLYHRNQSLLGVSVSHLMIGVWGLFILNFPGLVL